MSPSGVDTTVLSLEGFPGHSVSVLVYKDLTNAKELRELLTADKLPVHCSLIQAQLIPHLSVISAAAHTALAAESRGSLLSRASHSDLVVNLSGSRHVAESLRRFGLNEASTAVLVARLDATAEEMASLAAVIQGTPVPASDLPALCDTAAVMKLHKLSQGEVDMGGLAEAVLTRMAARDCM